MHRKQLRKCKKDRTKWKRDSQIWLLWKPFVSCVTLTCSDPLHQNHMLWWSIASMLAHRWKESPTPFNKSVRHHSHMVSKSVWMGEFPWKWVRNSFFFLLCHHIIMEALFLTSWSCDISQKHRCDLCRVNQWSISYSREVFCSMWVMRWECFHTITVMS